MKKIGIDIDGVILDFERMMRFYADYYDTLIDGNGKIHDDFNYLNNYNWNKWEQEEFKNNYLALGTRECTLIPGSKEIIDLLHNNGLQIILISARGSINKEMRNEVIKILEKYNIYYDEAHFEITDKVRICKELGIDLMIDDNPNICNGLKNAKVKTIYLKDSDNFIKDNEFLKTATNWGEIFSYLIKSKIINMI